MEERDCGSQILYMLLSEIGKELEEAKEEKEKIHFYPLSKTPDMFSGATCLARTLHIQSIPPG